MIALAVVTDGRRDCIMKTIRSARAHLRGPISLQVIYDDSGSQDNYNWLRQSFPDFVVIRHPDGRQGFGGAIRTVWSYLRAQPESHIFHLEDDFTFNRVVDLSLLTDLLQIRPHLAQIALRRQPWNADEKKAGGIVEQHPGDYTDEQADDLQWLEHSRFFTTNPSLYRKDLLSLEWPEGANSEGNFTFKCLDAGMRFAFWGERTDDPWVTHIGDQRAGTGY